VTKDELVTLSEYTFTSRIRPRLDGLTDDEYFWEPVPRCWSLRPDPAGVCRIDFAPLVPPDRHPFTTLAWRLWHLVGCYGATRNANVLGVEPTSGEFDGFAAAPATAAEALDALDRAYGWWASMLRSFPEEAMSDKLGPVAGPWAEASKTGFILHQLDEVIHHGAETALMRDLYRGQRTPREEPASVMEAAANGYWADVRAFLATGSDATSTEPDELGRTALHFAAACGPLDVVKSLLERGADRSARDGQFHATPQTWAEFFGRDEVAGHLRDS
jgi:hypothetical protein